MRLDIWFTGLLAAAVAVCQATSSSDIQRRDLISDLADKIISAVESGLGCAGCEVFFPFFCISPWLGEP
jgi:hypothetical protein